MLQNYFKIALRNLFSRKLYSFITIFGLAFGMACFLMIFGYVRFEKSYNNFHRNAKNIYRIDKEVKEQGYTYYRSLVGASLAPILSQEFSTVKNTVRFAYCPYCLINSDENAYRERRFLFADSNVFNMFSFTLKVGDPRTALANPFSVVVTPQTAKKYFDDENPVGKIIYCQVKGFQGKFAFTITGVSEEIPSNSTIKFDFLASFSSYGKIIGNAAMDNSWDGPIWTYVQLQDNSDPKKLEALFPSFAEQHVPKTDLAIKSFRLVPLKDTYYERGDGLPLMDYGIKPISYLLLIVSVLVLLIACINYTNLLSAQSIMRAKEIGVRKVHGAAKLQLILQFIGESVIVSLLSFLFAVALVELMLPSFKMVMMNAFPTFGLLPKREFTFNIFDPVMLLWMSGIAAFVGIISGVYPAIILSRFKSAYVLKGEAAAGKSGPSFRRILVVTQFAVSVIFIVCSLHILLQLHYWKNAALGFNKNNLVAISVVDNSVKEKYDLFKNRLMRSSEILGVTSSNLLPGGDDINLLFFRSGTVKDLQVGTYFVDKDFVKTVGLKIEGGRDFTNFGSTNPQSSILMNKAAMKACGWDRVSGQQVDLYTRENDIPNVIYRTNVIGEVNDFQYRPLETTTFPLILKIAPDVMNYILVRVNDSNSPKAIEDIRVAWKDMNFEQSFEYSYVKDEIEDSYAFIEALDSFIRFGAIMTIIIASLGLFALASFVIDRKTKEIGIRKVLGAPVSNIVLKLAGSFVLLVLIANIIGIAVSTELTSLLLQQLPNHVGVSFWLLSATFVFLILLSMVVVGMKSFKAAIVNPVTSLRYE